MPSRRNKTPPKLRSSHKSPRQRKPTNKKKAFLKKPKTIDLSAAKQTTLNQIRKWQEESSRIEKPKEIRLDHWQQKAVDCLSSGQSVVVDAPTTAGKTLVVEEYFRLNLGDPNFRAVYTCPVKSLSNDKLREFRETFGSELVGISTGDFKENLSAPIVVATLESYRNSLLGVEPDLNRNLVVFDEYHYIQDESRGSAWEEAIILTPQTSRILLLSASVSNANEFAEWIEKVHEQKCELIRVEERPVPLTNMVYYHGDWYSEESLTKRFISHLPVKSEEPLPLDVVAQRASRLDEVQLTPTILYAGRRLSCEQVANVLRRHLKPLPEDESKKIIQTLKEADDELQSHAFMDQNLYKMVTGFGLAYHHSGMAPPVRVAIEILLKKGQLKFCVGTMGLSLGVNFSVRSAIICDYRRPGEQGFTQYSPSETLQMLGRAGRRGKDVIGYSCWTSTDAYKKFANVSRKDCVSRLRNDATTFLGLVGRGFSLPDLEVFYAKSFRRFRNRQFDLTLIHKSRVEKKLKASTPCTSPASEITTFWDDEMSSLCRKCQHRPKCHQFLRAKSNGGLTAMHLHLHQIGALNQKDELTDFGNVARYFPQSGGLLLARLITDGFFTADNLELAVELMGAMGLARFKEPGVASNYEFSFDAWDVERRLEEYYPYEQFAELYDPPFGRRRKPVFREFNPLAGYIVRSWIAGKSWNDLTSVVTHESFGIGDMMGLIYRTSTYLQSVVQIRQADLSDRASDLRSKLLRPPLALSLG